MIRHLIRFVFSLFLAVLIALCSKVTLGSDPEHSVLRLSWVHVGEKISKKLSQEELDALPIHMRPQDGILESVAIPYVLEVSVDGELLSRETVNAAGLQSDRPMYVYRNFDLPPGEHQLKVLFGPDHEVEDAVSYRFERMTEFEVGRVVTIGIIRDQAELVIK